MAIFNEAAQAFKRFTGGEYAPIGSFWNPLSMEVFQQASDGALPKDGTFFQITTSNGSSLAACATAINTGLGTTYTSANLHTHVAGDVLTYPGAAAAQDA